MDAIEVLPLDLKRFNVLAGHTRSSGASFFSKEIAWYSNEDETVLGIICLDTIDHDYAAITLGRDESDIFRAFDLETSIPTVEDAKTWLFGAVRWHTSRGKKIFPQGEPGKGIDLFTPVVPIEKQHPYFVRLTSTPHLYSAKSVINAIMPYFADVDGNFVEQFQSTGFDSRVWELYLNSFFKEEELFIGREHNAPDFILEKYGVKVAVEAVIVGRKPENPVKFIPNFDGDKSPEDMAEFTANVMPVKWGSPLYSKMQKKYWELDHVNGNALVFAIADFHDDHSMVFSSTALIDYLYGYKHESYYDENKQLVIKPVKIETHIVGEKEIPSGFFFQPNAENISAVMSTSSGTISKFNRIGRQAGFKDPNVTMMRMGSCHNHDPNAAMPRMFKYIVDENSKETWGEGMSMYHNPNARHPVPEELFPNIAHHHFDNGYIVSSLPDFHPYSSMTYNFAIKE
jgi:hypothetical protein